MVGVWAGIFRRHLFSSAVFYHFLLNGTIYSIFITLEESRHYAVVRRDDQIELLFCFFFFFFSSSLLSPSSFSLPSLFVSLPRLSFFPFHTVTIPLVQKAIRFEIDRRRYFSFNATRYARARCLPFFAEESAVAVEPFLFYAARYIL